MGKYTSVPSSGVPELELVLASDGNNLCAWTQRHGSSPRAEKINGEDILSLGRSNHNAITKAFQNVRDKLRADSAAPCMAHLLLNVSARRRWLEECANRHASDEDLPPWQMLAWEWLQRRFPRLPNALDGNGRASVNVLQQQVLPWLFAADNTTERQRLAGQRESEDRSERARLADERQLLAQENERLRAENDSMRQMNDEVALCYLPALYEGVFSSNGISSTDLALLCGHMHPVNIPSPYPEPTPEAQAELQRRFSKLSREEQRRIVVIAQPYKRLQPRPAVRRLIEELLEEGVTNI